MTGYDLINLLFLAIAVVVFFRLRSVLGKRTGNERPPSDPYASGPFERRRQADDARAEDKAEDNVIHLPGSADPAPDAAPPAADSPVAAGLTQIGLADRGFSPQSFLDGAGKAHEMIVTAFAAGDRETLRRLLDDTVYRDFDTAIEDRQSEGRRLEQSYVGLSAAEITEAVLEDGRARVTVQFTSDMTSAVRSAAGDIVEGSPEAVRQVVDVWTFERVVSSRDPNWKLVATGGS